MVRKHAVLLLFTVITLVGSLASAKGIEVNKRISVAKGIEVNK